MKVCDPCSSALYAGDFESDDRRINYQSRFRYHKGEVCGYMNEYQTPRQKAEEKYLDEIFTRHMRNL